MSEAVSSEEVGPPAAAAPPDVRPLTRLDQIGAWAAAIPATSLLAIPISVAPTFERMFVDMGAPLPILTQWVLAGWFPVGLAVVPGLLLGFALLAPGRLTHTQRRLAIAASFVVGVLGIAACLMGLYLPIFGASAPPGP